MYGLFIAARCDDKGIVDVVCSIVDVSGDQLSVLSCRPTCSLRHGGRRSPARMAWYVEFPRLGTNIASSFVSPTL